MCESEIMIIRTFLSHWLYNKHDLSIISHYTFISQPAFHYVYKVLKTCSKFETVYGKITILFVESVSLNINSSRRFTVSTHS